MLSRRCLLVFPILAAILYAQFVDFDDRSAAEKQAALFLECEFTSDDQGRRPTFVDFMEFAIASLDRIFDRSSETYRTKRKKILNSKGMVAKVRFDALENPYTGLFQGSEYGLVRLSQAGDGDAGEVIPGAAFKFLRSGMISGNIVAQPRLDGQEEKDFFESEFRTNLPESRQRRALALERKFKMASGTKYPNYVGLSEFASFDGDGNEASQIVFPYHLTFESPLRGDDIRDGEFGDRIPAGTLLFNVFARPAPGADLERIGSIVTTSEFISSLYGDTRLFFRHQLIEDDLDLRPEWEDAVIACVNCYNLGLGYDPDPEDTDLEDPDEQ